MPHASSRWRHGFESRWGCQGISGKRPDAWVLLLRGPRPPSRRCSRGSLANKERKPDLDHAANCGSSGRLIGRRMSRSVGSVKPAASIRAECAWRWSTRMVACGACAGVPLPGPWVWLHPGTGPSEGGRCGRPKRGELAGGADVTRSSSFAAAAAVVLLAACGVGCGDDPDAGSGPTTTESTTTTAAAPADMTYVALGPSWPEGAHSNGCQPFPELHSEALQVETGRTIEFKNLAGQAQPGFGEGGGMASLLDAVGPDEAFRAEVASGDVIVIATGPNEGDAVMEAVAAGTCGGTDHLDCGPRAGAAVEREPRRDPW